MNFDPGFHEEMYDDNPEEMEPVESEDEIEYDEMGNPIYLAAAAGFGYHMSQDELEERKLAEDILKRKAKEKDEGPIKVPLSSRHKGKGREKRGPDAFQRWAAKVRKDPSRTSDELEYTKEETIRMIKEEGGY